MFARPEGIIFHLKSWPFGGTTADTSWALFVSSTCPNPFLFSSLLLHQHGEALSSALSRLRKVPECLLVSLLNLP